MTEFYSNWNKVLRGELIEFIERTLKTMEGQKCCLIDPALDPEEDDIYFDLPIAIHFGRYDYGTIYVVTSVRLEDDNIWFNGLSTSDYSDEFSFSANDIETSALADIADTLHDLKQEQDGRI
jgi:hypothetical protein